MKRLILGLVIAIFSITGRALPDGEFHGIWNNEDEKSTLILYAGVAIVIGEERVQNSGPFQYVFYDDGPDELVVKWEGKWHHFLVRFPTKDILDLQPFEDAKDRKAVKFDDPARFIRAK